MFIPLGTDRPLERPTLLVYALIAINAAVFVAQAYARRFTDADAFAPFVLASGGDLAFLGSEFWTLVTYGFLHADTLHLVFNMLFLYVMGPNVEDRFGRVGFLAFYLGGVIVSGLVHLTFSFYAVIGASGGVAAVTGAYLVLFPKTRIKVLWLFGIVIIPSWWIIAFAIARDFLPIGLWRSNIAH
ncbi:MAG: rhomboid family intramembrane serine protease, partial [Planctomycetota bacterium]